MERWPLPEGWEWRTLAEVCEINPRRPAIQRDDDAPTSFVPMAAVDEVEGRLVEVQIRPYGEVKRGYTYFEENDVVFAKITPCMENGKAAIAQGLLDGFGFGTTEFHVLRPRPGVLPEWIHRYVRQVSFRAEAKKHFRGAVGQQRVPQEFLESSLIPLPYPDDPARSLETQRRIVARLDALLAEVAAARRLHAEIAADTARVMEAVRDEVFSELATRAPKAQFSEIADSRLGKMLSQASKSGVYSRPYLRNANVLWDEFKLDDVYEMDFLPEEREEFLLKPGDILICEGGEIGRCAVWEGQIEECYFQKALHRARLKDPCSSPRYLMHFIAWAAEHGAIAELRTGSAIPHLTGVKLKTLEVIWPEPRVQHQVVVTLDQIKAEITEMRVSESENALLLDQIEQSILFQGFRGELL
ncbi:MAG: restriction endonuclease subunit S [Gemmatales bacterium]|nr:restriction endonuclease subunit S [Gemmatales bacterium]